MLLLVVNLIKIALYILVVSNKGSEKIAKVLSWILIGDVAAGLLLTMDYYY